MCDYKNILSKILNLPPSLSFEDYAFETFQFQYKNVVVYQNYCNQIEVNKPSSIKEIPFLPISFFKTHEVIATQMVAQKIFLSSGTSSINRSRHCVADIGLYEKSFNAGFESVFGVPEDCVILGLLPNYIEQGDSSLIYMVQKLIELSKNELSGFCLNDFKMLLRKIHLAQKQNKKIVLFGVTYALLDLAEIGADLSDVTIVETGGMKGRRKEMIREELHQILKTKFNVNQIYSEYGMTELLSQAYSTQNDIFQPTEGMSILIRDTTDPFNYVPKEKTGGINIIDLYNIYSCSFIATQDLGKLVKNGFQVLGRFDQSEIRGCNLLVN